MAERGGSSTVAGVVYQAWVAAEKMAEAVLDESISIQLEGKADSKGKLIIVDDIIVIKSAKKEFINCKHQAPRALSWTFSGLKEQGVLEQLKKQHKSEPDQMLYFVTESPCPIIQEGFAKSASSTSIVEATARLTKSDKNYCQKIKDYLSFTDDEMFNFTKKVGYERKVIVDIEKNIRARLELRFTNSGAISVLLKSFALETAKRGETVTRNNIVDYLKEHGCYQKTAQSIEKILGNFKSASSLISEAVSTIGSNIHIKREEVSKLLDWVEGSTEAKHACLFGLMGAGKTVIMKELYTELTKKSIPCIAIKSDRYSNIKNRLELSKELELQDGILEYIATVIDEKERCVVIIDQLDALSDTIARDRTAINVFYDTIMRLSSMQKVKIVTSVRRFDLEHDPILSNIPFDIKIEAGLLKYDEVQKILSDIGIQHDRFTNKQIELFRIPLHLKILGEIDKSSILVEPIQTLQDLYDRLWEKKIKSGENAQAKTNVLKMMTDKMDKKQELTIPYATLDEFPDAGKELLSNGIIIKAGKNSIAYFHQSFFDYCFARSFIITNVSLFDKIISEHQGLFVRSQIKHTVLYLRGADHKRYIGEVTDMLRSDKIRFHIKDLLISFIGSQYDPIEEEIIYIKSLFRGDISLRDHFLKNAYAPRWFEILAKDYLKPIISDEQKPVVFEYLLKIANNHTNEIVSLIDNMPNSDEKFKIIARVLKKLTNWTDGAIELYRKHRNQMVISEGLQYHIIGKIYKVREIDAVNLFFEEFDNEIRICVKEDKDIKEDVAGNSFQKLFQVFIKKHPYLVIEEFTKRLKSIVEVSKYEQEDVLYRDKVFLLYECVKVNRYNLWIVMTNYLNILFEQLQCGNAAIAEKVVSILLPTRSHTLNRVLAWIYTELPDVYVDNSYDLLKDPKVLHTLGYDARVLLKKIYSFFNAEQRHVIEASILSYESEWEKSKDNKQFRGIAQYLALASIPNELLSTKAMRRLQELERKFKGYKDAPPVPAIAYAVGPPLPQRAYDKMSLEQWLSSFNKYDDTTSWDARRHASPEGGVIEHSRAFKDAIIKRPDFFYEFALELVNENVSSRYIANAIEGVVESACSREKIRKIVLQYSDSSEINIRKSVISAIKNLDNKEPIDSDLLEILARYSLTDRDPERELYTELSDSNSYYYGGDALLFGINTVRGGATIAITHHGFRTPNPEGVFQVLEVIANDTSVSVRACLVADLHGMLEYDKHRTFSIFQKATGDMSNEVLKNSRTFLWSFILSRNCCNDHNFKAIVPYLEKMVHIGERDFNISEGHIAMMAYILEHEGSKEFLDIIITTTKNARKGITDICMVNITNKRHRVKCEEILTYLLDNHLSEIYESIDRHLCDVDTKDFTLFYPILKKTIGCKNGRRNYYAVIEFLSRNVSDYPDECIDILNNVVHYPVNIITDRMVAVLSSAYMKASTDEIKNKAMDIIDVLYEDDYPQIKKLISALDR
ncbi:MAG: ATP-binding protein [Nitrospirae bacterium]|nr:ATP-binding protein [Nitrospirota bacterium]